MRLATTELKGNIHYTSTACYNRPPVPSGPPPSGLATPGEPNHQHSQQFHFQNLLSPSHLTTQHHQKNPNATKNKTTESPSHPEYTILLGDKCIPIPIFQSYHLSSLPTKVFFFLSFSVLVCILRS